MQKEAVKQGGGGYQFLSYALWHLVRQLSGSKKARGPKPVAVIAAEDGTPLLHEAEIAARWESIFFQEFSGRGERVQSKDLGSRLQELRIPWQAQLRPRNGRMRISWLRTPVTPWDGCETEKPWGTIVFPRSTCVRLVQDISGRLRGWLSDHSRKGCRADGEQVAWFQCP